MNKLLAIALLGILAFAAACQQSGSDNSNKMASSENANSSAADQQQGSQAGGDDWITLKAKLALIADKRTSGFDTSVDTKDGTVTLSGKVDSPDSKMAATEVAEGINGVKSVDNELQVVPDAKRKQVDQADSAIDSAVSKVMKGDSDLKDLSLNAKTNNGVVVMTGTVDTGGELVAAAEAVRKIDGVKAVDTKQVDVKNQISRAQ
ncbi:MAG TPA: BON domain-containing protein [Blastocatellia bacterium]|nr:BON domain-containing protein [Blastocatellia bacterium]